MSVRRSLIQTQSMSREQIDAAWEEHKALPDFVKEKMPAAMRNVFDLMFKEKVEQERAGL